MAIAESNSSNAPHNFSHSLHIERASKLINDVVQEKDRDVSQLFSFAYELLKQDVDQKYTPTILDGNIANLELE